MTFALWIHREVRVPLTWWMESDGWINWSIKSIRLMSVCEITKQTLLMWIWAAVTQCSPRWRNTNHLVLLISANAVICDTDKYNQSHFRRRLESFRARRSVFFSSAASEMTWAERVANCLDALGFKSWEIQLYIKMLMEQHSQLIV